MNTDAGYVSSEMIHVHISLVAESSLNLMILLYQLVAVMLRVGPKDHLFQPKEITHNECIPII